jgi:hypothetical protein
MNLPVAPFYVMPPDKAAAIKILLYQLTAGWCKVGYSTPMNVKLSETPPFTNPPNVGGNGLILKEKVTNLEVSEKKSKFE